MRRPLVLLYWSYWFRSTVRRAQAVDRSALSIGVESNTYGVDIVYAHFCHTYFLSHHWSDTRPARKLSRLLRWLDHRSHAALEGPTFRKARLIVAPTAELAWEIETTWPRLRGKLSIIPNPVAMPASSEVAWPLARSPRRLCFIALGQFERKGLGCILDALSSMSRPSISLTVVGGSPHLIEHWKKLVIERHPSLDVHFFGFTEQPLSLLAKSHGLILMSSYEVQPLVVLQAMAAGRPVILSDIPAHKLLLPKGAGWLVDSDAAPLTQALESFASSPDSELICMGARGRAFVASRHSEESFADSWRTVLAADA